MDLSASRLSYPAQSTKTIPSWAWCLAVVLIASLALMLRCRALGVDGLWQDEVFGASFANLNPLEIIIAVLRFDIPPPFYYLQLKLWSLPSVTDEWLLANSVAWSMGTLLAATYGAYRLAGPATALFSAALLAVSGSEIYYATELRMYAMISCLTVIGWIRAERWIDSPELRNAVWLVVVLGALAGTHSSAFVPVSSVLLYALLGRWSRFGFKGLMRSWGVVLSVGILLVPWLVNASMRSVSHTGTPAFGVVVKTLSGWILGYGALEMPSTIRLVTALTIAAFVMVGLIFGNRTTRHTLLSFVIWPILILAIVSLVVRPVWIDRAVAFCAPFLVLSIALLWHSLYSRNRGMSRHHPMILISLIGIFCATLGAVAWGQAGLSRKMQYREAAQFIAQANTERLPIYVPINVAFWGMARYLQNPSWGSVLEIQDPAKADGSETWARIYARLGTAWLTRLGLVPKTRELATPNGTMWIGFSPLPSTVTSVGFWEVGNNDLLKDGAGCASATREEVRQFRGVVVIRCKMIAK
jgi:mannosyltransferase